MKRSSAILLGGILLITASFVLLISLSHTVIPAVTRQSEVKKDSAFPGYPEGRAVNVSLVLQPDDAAKLNMRERIDQVRDWLLYTILSDAGLSPEQLAQSTYDLPLIRAGYNETISNFDYTRTRSRAIGDGVVVALIPASASEEEKEYVAHIADEQRKNSGSIPNSLILFTYTIDTANNRADIKRTGTIPGANLFTSEYGYFEQKINAADDLKTFLQHTRDLVFAKQLSDGLLLGGRQFSNTGTRNLTMEDIAALYQSEEQIKQKNDAFDTKWSSKRFTSDIERSMAERDRDREAKDLHLVNGSGFSLDPSYNYQELAGLIKYFRPVLLDYTTDDKITDLYNSALGKDEGPFLEFLYDLKQKPDDKAREVARTLSDYQYRCQFQKARYDGDLQGTAVGMHLFYTDLLAKLWTLNFANSSPMNSIYGFVNGFSSKLGLSKIYKRESDSFPACRLWFGPNNNGYQIVGSNDRLLFARNATRIYSASSDPLQPGKEVPVSAMFAGPMNWMNGHYEEIAAYDQEYAVLNEIMKWSIVIGWLNSQGNGDKLQFLHQMAVNRDHDFTEWVKEHPELSFKDWDQIKFYEKGHLGAETEALPILFKEYPLNGKRWTLSGGVSLADRSAIKSMSALSEDVNVLMRRSNLDYSTAGNELKFLKGATYDFESMASGYSVTAKAAENTRIRGRYGELENFDFERTIARESDDIEFKFAQNKTPIGDLRIEKIRNGFEVGFHSRDIERVQSFARELSDAADPGTLIQASDKIEGVATLEPGKEFLLKIKGSNKWVRLQLQDEPDVFLGSDWDSRVAGTDPDSRICLIKFMSEEEARSFAGSRPFNYKSSYATNPVAQSFEKGKYHDVIGEFSKSGDLGAFKIECRNKYLKDLHALDAVTDKVEYDAALRDMEAEYTATPELKIRSALRSLDRGDYAMAEELFNDAFDHGLHAESDFYQDVARIIKNTDLGGENQQALFDFLLLSDKHDPGVAKLYFDALPPGKRASVLDVLKEAHAGRARVFVENSPGLNNIDWAQAMNDPSFVNLLPPGAKAMVMDETSLAGYHYDLKIEPGASASNGHYQIKLSAKSNPHVNSNVNTDTTNKPTYYIYTTGATTRI